MINKQGACVLLLLALQLLGILMCADLFFHAVASPFQPFVTTGRCGYSFRV